MNDAAMKIMQARTALVLDEPFFGALALRLQTVEDATLKPPTMCTDGKVLKYHPDFVTSLSHDETKFAIAHEVLHCANGHVWRLDGRNHAKFNQATDYAINPILHDAGFVYNKDHLNDSRYKGMSAEQIYEQLLDSKNDDDSKQSEQGAGQPGEFEQPGTPEEQAQSEADWKVATIQAATMAQAQGQLHGSLKGLVKQLKQTRIDWRNATLKFAQERSKNDFSYTAPNKRYVQHGLYLPCMKSEQMGEIIVVIDTSGSVQSVIPMFGAHLQTILDTVRPRAMRVIYCDDCNITDDLVDIYEPDDILHVRRDGGGGTSFIPPFNYVEQESIEPACLIYLTDLEGPAPKHAPSYPVLWACTERDNIGPWGETIFIGDA